MTRTQEARRDRWLVIGYGVGWLAMAVLFAWHGLDPPREWHTVHFKVGTGAVALLVGSIWPLWLLAAFILWVASWL